MRGMNIACHYHGRASRSPEFSKMNAFPVPFKVVATVLLTILMVSLGVLNLRDRTSWSDPSDGIFWEQSEAGLRALEVAPDGPGAQAGIRPGDILLSLDGRPVGNLGEYSALLYRTGQNGSILYGLMSGLQAKEVTLQLVPKPLMDAKDGLRILLAFFYLGNWVVCHPARPPLIPCLSFLPHLPGRLCSGPIQLHAKMGRVGPMGLRAFDPVLSGASAAVPPLLPAFSRRSGTRSQSRAASLHSGWYFWACCTCSGRRGSWLELGLPRDARVAGHPGPYSTHAFLCRLPDRWGNLPAPQARGPGPDGARSR